MTTIKIGNQEVELEAAKKLRREASCMEGSNNADAYYALSTAIKEAEEVEGPFGRNEDGHLTFRGEVVSDSDGDKVYVSIYLLATLNRILSRYFVSKDELRKVLIKDGTIAGRGWGPNLPSRHTIMRNALRALIEKGAPDA